MATTTKEPVATRASLARVTEVAEYLNVSRSKVYMMMDAGDLAFIRLGTSRRIPWAAVEKLVAENTIGATA